VVAEIEGLATVDMASWTLRPLRDPAIRSHRVSRRTHLRGRRRCAVVSPGCAEAVTVAVHARPVANGFHALPMLVDSHAHARLLASVCHRKE
jgi:hypothetical protein